MPQGIEDYIKYLLEGQAKTDKELAQLLKKDNKSYKECAEYIKEWCLEGRQRTNGMGVGGSDEELLGKCIHYFQEDEVKPKGSAKNVKAVAPKATPKKEEDVDFSSCDWGEEEEETKPQVKVDFKVVKKPTEKKPQSNNDSTDDIFGGCDW